MKEYKHKTRILISRVTTTAPPCLWEYISSRIIRLVCKSSDFIQNYEKLK